MLSISQPGLINKSVWRVTVEMRWQALASGRSILHRYNGEKIINLVFGGWKRLSKLWFIHSSSWALTRYSAILLQILQILRYFAESKNMCIQAVITWCYIYPYQYSPINWKLCCNWPRWIDYYFINRQCKSVFCRLLTQFLNTFESHNTPGRVEFRTLSQQMNRRKNVILTNTIKISNIIK